MSPSSNGWHPGKASTKGTSIGIAISLKKLTCNAAACSILASRRYYCDQPVAAEVIYKACAQGRLQEGWQLLNGHGPKQLTSPEKGTDVTPATERFHNTPTESPDQDRCSSPLESEQCPSQ